MLQVGIGGRGIPSPGAKRDGRALQRVSSIPGGRCVWGDGAGLSRAEGPTPCRLPEAGRGNRGAFGTSFSAGPQ